MEIINMKETQSNFEQGGVQKHIFEHLQDYVENTCRTLFKPYAKYG